MNPHRPIRRAQAVCFALLLGLLAPAMLRAQGRIQGKVVNGTVQRPLGNQKVLLLTPQQGQGMQLIADTTTDGNGHFAFTQSGIAPGSFYLLQANFQEIPYHAGVPPKEFDSSGAATVDITVYESTHDASTLRVRALRVLVGAEGQKLRVQEEYLVENLSRPERTYSNPKGTFVFYVSPQAGEPKVSVTGLANMALSQATVRGKSAGEYEIPYPLKPGITPVTVTYDVDYSGGQFSLNDRSAFPLAHAELFVFPSSLKVESTIFKPAGMDASNNIQKFEADNVPPGTPLVANLSGEAAVNPRSQANSTEGEIKAVPNTMTRLGIPLFICFLLVLLWALGVRAGKEWAKWKEHQTTGRSRKQLEAKTDALFNSVADLDELFEAGKIEKKKYWKERLELKAKLMVLLKKSPPLRKEPYATRRSTH